MKFYSLNKLAPKVGFKEAVINGIAPDSGLYYPQSIHPLPASFFNQIESLSHTEIAMQAIRQFVGSEIPDAVLKKILQYTLGFDFPLVEIEQDIASLELYHGPTMAFKDVGARFMASCLGYFSEGNAEAVTVLVATSGDTGGAVAHGFLGVEGVQVVILYPSGKVSDVQERQLTTLGQNITALEVQGTFDDCQQMVKKAFLDKDLRSVRQFTSANSINVARWLPQLFYFLFAFKEVKTRYEKITFSVPSGNFGNLCAGLVAQKLGMPSVHFIASTNVNDTVPEFLRTGQYHPRPSRATISSAMDVGDPSNFIRIRHLFNNDLQALSQQLSSYSFTDEQTKKAILEIFRTTGYVADPHGAVAYLGLKKYRKSHPGGMGIFLETAHPYKFLDVIEPILGMRLTVPAQLEELLHRTKSSIPITGYQQLKEHLMHP